MPSSCAIVGCSNKSGRDEKRYFRLPKPSIGDCKATNELLKERRDKWLHRISRSDLDQTLPNAKNLDNIRVCSDHFISGRCLHEFKFHIQSARKTISLIIK